MGVDTYIAFPPHTRVKDVATVLGAIVGLPVVKHDHSATTWWAKVDGVTVTQCPDMVEMVTIIINGDKPMIDGEDSHMAFYHLEGDRQGNRLMSVRSTPFWIAVSTKLVDFFGGWVDYNDCDDQKKDYVRACPRETNSVESGEEWISFHQEIIDISPVTKQEIIDAAPHASYEFDYVATFKADLLNLSAEHLLDAMEDDCIEDWCLS